MIFSLLTNQLFASTAPEVSIGPEQLFTIGGFPVTNSHILALVAGTLILVLTFSLTRAIKRGSRSRFVYAATGLFESLYDTTVEVVGDKSVARKVLPLGVTLFLFFLFNNWLGLLPIL